MTTKEHFEKNVLPFFNIKEYWDKGFKGKGIKVCSMESWTDDDHGYDVRNTVLTYAPECTFVSYTEETGNCSFSDNNIHQEFPLFVDWCIKNNVDIITSSVSWQCDKENEREAVRKLYDHGIIFCNCASNEGGHNQFTEYKHPWSFDKEIVCVSGIMLNVNKKISWSGFNYGEAVDVCTIGSNCPTVNQSSGSMYSWSGTSAATPMCAGMLALYKSFDKTLNSKNVFEKLINKMDKTIDYNGYTHKILVLPKIESVEVEMPNEEIKPDWKIEFEEIWKKATEKGIVDGTRPNDSVTRNELIVILNRLGLIK